MNSGGQVVDQPLSHDLLPDLSTRVARVLDYFFPCLLLQKQLTTQSGGLFQPNKSMQFRALVLPERKYFSFRREGKVVVKVLEKNTSGTGGGGSRLTEGNSASSKPRSRTNSTTSADTLLDPEEKERWALCFRNSSYDGEFSDTLSLFLYRCPEVSELSNNDNRVINTD